MDQIDALKIDIDTFLAETGMAPATFGKLAMGDPKFVFDLRGGREPKRRTIERVREFLQREAAQ